MWLKRAGLGLCEVHEDFFKNIYSLFIWLHWVLDLSSLLWHAGSSSPDQESNLGPLHWKLEILATDHQGSPQEGV